MSTDTIPDRMTYPEAARYTRLSESTLYRMVREGGLKPVHVRRRVFFTRQSLDAMLAAENLPNEG